MSNNKRLNILSKSEIEQIYAIPKFTYEERSIYFAINSLEKEIALSHHFLHAKIFFILQLGYFKNKKRFFTFTLQDVYSDTQHIIKQNFPDAKDINCITIPRSTRNDQQKRILSLFDYRICIKTIKENLYIKAS